MDAGSGNGIKPRSCGLKKRRHLNLSVLFCVYLNLF